MMTSRETLQRIAETNLPSFGAGERYFTHVDAILAAAAAAIGVEYVSVFDRRRRSFTAPDPAGYYGDERALAEILNLDLGDPADPPGAEAFEQLQRAAAEALGIPYRTVAERLGLSQELWQSLTAQEAERRRAWRQRQGQI